MGLISLIAGGITDANKAIKQKQAQNDDTVKTIVVKNKYSIDIPSFLSPTDKFGEDASLQYYSKMLDVSFQVIDESKREFIQTMEELKDELPNIRKGNTILDRMATLVLSNLFDDINKVEIGNYQKININGLEAVVLNAFQKRTFFKDALYGSFAFVEGKETLYQIIILSGGTSIPKLSDKLEKSIRSFREI